MRTWELYKYNIEFLDGEERSIGNVGGCTVPHTIKDGVLHLWYKSGDMEPATHVLSIPLTSIKTWKRDEQRRRP